MTNEINVGNEILRDYKWFIFGTFIAANRYFWEGKGNKPIEVKNFLSNDGNVITTRPVNEENSNE